MTDDSRTIATDAPLSESARQTLAALLRCIIPPSSSHGVPGADDPEIVRAVAARLSGSALAVEQGLGRLDDRAVDQFGTRFPDLGDADRAALTEGMAADRFGRMVAVAAATCYYADERVLQALGMEARAPFPRGYDVEPGDWSLLDPVKRRAPIYRDVP